MSIVTVSNNSMTVRETRDEIEKSIRRASFERKYIKRVKILKGIKCPELIKFSDCVEKQISLFKSKRNEKAS